LTEAARQSATLTPTLSLEGKREQTEGCLMGDVLYLGLAVGFFALSWGLLRLCDRL
jgi:hypothetical protein